MKELLAEEAANRKDIEDVIEEERAKVDAKTPITQEVFLRWRQKNRDDKLQAAEAAEAERKRKGVMTGREIFAQVPFWSGGVFPFRGIPWLSVLMQGKYPLIRYNCQ